MPQTITSLIIFWCLYTSQLLCRAAPIIVEMNHTYPLTGEKVETRIKIDDSLMERILLEQAIRSLSSTSDVATNTPEVNEGSYDYYDLDCAMPMMPPLIYDDEDEPKDTLTVRQVEQPRTRTVMDSIVSGLNGIAMSVAAAGFGAYNFLRSNVRMEPST